MSFDPTAPFGAETRTVATTERDGKPAKAVIATRHYPTGAADLWDAITNGERIPRWFLPISGDLKLGGHYMFEGNAGGTITGCEPEQRLEATWEFGGEVSWITISLTPESDGTLLRLEHVAHPKPEFWDTYGPGAVGVGWEGGLFGLAWHIATGESVTGERSQEWQASEAGKQLYRDAAIGWGEAAIAAGEDPAQARAAAERTRQFYTGEVPPQG